MLRCARNDARDDPCASGPVPEGSSDWPRGPFTLWRLSVKQNASVALCALLCPDPPLTVFRQTGRIGGKSCS